MAGKVAKTNGLYQIVFWLFVLGQAAGLLIVIQFLTNPSLVMETLRITSTPFGVFLLRPILSAIALICLYGVYMWKKWGLYGLVATIAVNYLLSLYSKQYYPVVMGFIILFLVYKYVLKPVLSKFK